VAAALLATRWLVSLTARAVEVAARVASLPAAVAVRAASPREFNRPVPLTRGKRVGKVSKRAGLQPCGVREFLRTTWLCGDIVERRQQRRHGAADSGLNLVAIKSERSGDAPDHVGR